MSRRCAQDEGARHGDVRGQPPGTAGVRGVGSCPTVVGAMSRGWSRGAQGKGGAEQKSEGIEGTRQGRRCGRGRGCGRERGQDAVGKVEKMVPGGSPLSKWLPCPGVQGDPPI